MSRFTDFQNSSPVPIEFPQFASKTGQTVHGGEYVTFYVEYKLVK